MVVECVTLETNHNFDGNPIAEQHRLRYRSIIQRQEWDVPRIRNIEYDQYDNPASTYLVWRDEQGKAGGVSRLYPTDRPFMLSEHFSHMATYGAIPTGPGIWEGSRFCIDKDLTNAQRRRVARELILGYLEYGLDQEISEFIGIMYPAYWHNLFISVGWEPSWLGEACVTPDGKRSRAGSVHVSEENLFTVRANTGIPGPVLSYGKDLENVQAA